MKNKKRTLIAGIAITLALSLNAQVTDVTSNNASLLVTTTSGTVDVGFNPAHSNTLTATQYLGTANSLASFARRPVAFPSILICTGTASPTGGMYLAENQALNSNLFLSTNLGRIVFGNTGKGSGQMVLDGYLKNNLQLSVPSVIKATPNISSSSWLELGGSNDGLTMPSLILDTAVLMSPTKPLVWETDGVHAYWTDKYGTRHQLD